jgi:polysaccharide biosynthesis transport protein
MTDHNRPDPPSESRSLTRFEPRPPGVEWRGAPAWRGHDGPEATEAVDPRHYLQVLRNRWRVVVITFVLVVSAVAVGTMLQPRIYRAMGMIELRRQNSEMAPAEAAFEESRIADQHLETQYETLVSDALAQRVVQQLKGASAAGEISAEEERSIQQFHRRLIVNPIRGSRIVQIIFDSEDPVVAEKMVDATIDAYTAMRIEGGRTAQERLRLQADSARAQLLEAERRLQEYVRDNGLLLVDNSSGGSEDLVHERLRYLQQQLSEAEADRYRKESSHAVAEARNDGADSDVIRTLTVRAADLRSEYARLRATFTDDYPRAQQLRSQLAEIDSMLTVERSRVRNEVSGSYRAARYRQDLLLNAFNEQKALADRLAGLTAEYRIIRRDVEAHQQLYTVLQRTHEEASVAAALAVTEVGVMSRGVASPRPIRPDPRGNLTMAGILGLVFGIGLAFVREWVDDTVRSPDDASALGPSPVLALIPTLHANGNATDADRSALGEAFGTLRTAVLLDRAVIPPRSILVTSANPDEGKTTIVVNLALSMTKMGRRVLLIDADMRRPTIAGMLKIDPRVGLADHLEGRADWRSAVRHDVVPGLDVLVAGAPPSNPSELLSSRAMVELIRDAERAYDQVLIDSPALWITGPDARILMRLSGGVVLVIRSRSTGRALARKVMQQVPNLLGVVLNDTDDRIYQTYHASYPAQRTRSGELPAAV